MRCDGEFLVPYGDELITVLKSTLHLKCKDAIELSGNLLRHLLKALTLIYALDYRCTTIDWDASLSSVLPIRVSILLFIPFDLLFYRHIDM